MYVVVYTLHLQCVVTLLLCVTDSYEFTCLCIFLSFKDTDWSTVAKNLSQIPGKHIVGISLSLM